MANTQRNFITLAVTIAATNTAQQIPAAEVFQWVTIGVNSGNAADIYVGNSSSVTDATGVPFGPAATPSLLDIRVSLANTNQLWIYGTAGDKFYVIGS